MVGCWSWIDLPASCSRCSRSMPTLICSRRRQVDDDLALADDRALVLADLIALRQVGIEVVLPVEDRALVDLRLEAEAGAHRLAHAFLVDHRQHAGHRRIDEADMWRWARRRNRSRRPRTAWRCEVTWAWTSMPIDDLPVAGRALDELLGVGGAGMRVHRQSSGSKGSPTGYDLGGQAASFCCAPDTACRDYGRLCLIPPPMMGDGT